MNSYLIIVFYLGLGEGLRRCVSVVVTAFTGPLSKIPGPFVAKFTGLPWTIESLRGKHMNTPAQLFQKYGEIVRVGKPAPTIHV
jgi:hypothetical protein